MTSPASPSAERGPLGEVALLFLRLGATAFGGPAAHIAIMEEEVVRKRAWISREEFLDLLGAVNLIPGPNSTELAIHLGHRRAGWPGLLVAGSCFILPAALMVGALGWAYVQFGFRPEVARVMAGVQPVVLAVVLQALWNLGRSALKSRALGIIALLAFGASLLEVGELPLLLAAGAASLLVSRVKLRTHPAALLPFAFGAAGAPTTLGVFLAFAKIGSLIFGSGYVLLAFLRTDLVEHLHWLTERQLLDAIAIGQVTPGPVFTAATFVGYLVAGPRGAAAATLGIFLPGFILVAASGALLPRLSKSPVFRAFLDGVNAGSLALIAAVLVPLGRAALTGPLYALEALAAAALLLRFKVNAAWLVLGGAALGIASAALAGGVH